MGALERENRELRQAVGGSSGRELEGPPGVPGSPESPGPTDTPTGAPAGAQTATERPHVEDRRPWWRRLLGP